MRELEKYEKPEMELLEFDGEIDTLTVSDYDAEIPYEDAWSPLT